MKVLSIVHWHRYEHHDAKKCRRMPWVKTPTDQDGMGFLLLMDHQDGMAHFGAWNLILQLAAKCPRRGVLVTDGGRPLLAKAFSLKCHGSEKTFQVAIDRLVDIGWLEWVEWSGKDVASDQQPTGSPERRESHQRVPAVVTGDHQASGLAERGETCEPSIDSKQASRVDSRTIPESFQNDSGEVHDRCTLRGEEEERKKETERQTEKSVCENIQNVPRGTIDESDPEHVWVRERRSTWAQSLIRSGCKISAKSWMAWKGLVDRVGLEIVCEAALLVPGPDRWSGQTEAAAQAILKRNAEEDRRRLREHAEKVSAERHAQVEDDTADAREALIAHIMTMTGPALEGLSLELASIPFAETQLQAVLTKRTLSPLGFAILTKNPGLAAAAHAVRTP